MAKRNTTGKSKNGSANGRAPQTEDTLDPRLFDNAGSGGEPPSDDAADGGSHGEERSISLHYAAQQRYLNYALSVITSRALPDVRDGLKPVQRRILYTMWQQRLTADAKHRKCAGVVGAVMQHYHPHGNDAIYDALVRMAQPFVLRMAMVEGSGNFGSLDGDPPAAMRYTECRLAPLASPLLEDLSSKTVHLRPNYDGSRNEPVVLPAKLPNLLVNGSAGIAVGMATNIPPHNLGEVCKALFKILDDPEIKEYQLVADDAIQGPDFPTGGRITNSRAELRDIYKEGSGTIKLRAGWQHGSTTRGSKILQINSIPYGVNKAALVEQIAEVINSRKMPLLTNVTDLSTDDVRIDLELKRDADEQKVLAYLYKHTPLQVNFSVNLTALTPTENPEVGSPERLGLLAILKHFLIFRHHVVTSRLEHELATIEKRIHILEGFSLIFDALDEIIQIIRESDGKADAAEKIMQRFPVPTSQTDGNSTEASPQGKKRSKQKEASKRKSGPIQAGAEAPVSQGLDAEQTEAILELKLYRLARLEIHLVLEELNAKRSRGDEIRKLLADDEEDMSAGRWAIVREELQTLYEQYGGKRKDDPVGKRRTVIEQVEEEPQFSAEDFIVAEDNHVLVTADGWVKRQKQIADPANTRLREGDRVLSCQGGSTRSVMAFFSNLGTCFSARIADLPATTGYGEPIQKLFKLKDGERIVAAMSLDPRVIGDVHETQGSDYAPPTHGLAVSSDGYALRFGLESFAEPSKNTGRKFARPSKGAQVIHVEPVHGEETVIAASRQRHVMLCQVEEINYLTSPGKGVLLLKPGKDDGILGARTATDDRQSLTVKTSMGGEQRINTAKYEIASRGGKGRQIIKRGQLTDVIHEPPTPPPALEDADDG